MKTFVQKFEMAFLCRSLIHSGCLVILMSYFRNVVINTTHCFDHRYLRQQFFENKFVTGSMVKFRPLDSELRVLGYSELFSNYICVKWKHLL